MEKCEPEDLKWCNYCFTRKLVNDEDGNPVTVVVCCKHYQGIALMTDGICKKVKSPIKGYRKICCCCMHDEDEGGGDYGVCD